MAFTMLKTPEAAREGLEMLRRGRAQPKRPTPQEPHPVNWRQDPLDPDKGTKKDQPEEIKRTFELIAKGCMDQLEMAVRGVDIGRLVRQTHPVNQERIAHSRAVTKNIDIDVLALILLLDDPYCVQGVADGEAKTMGRAMAAKYAKARTPRLCCGTNVGSRTFYSQNRSKGLLQEL